ncbi:MAG: hypothetical protein Q9171_004327 [Xanthocarpia ochracea]
MSLKRHLCRFTATHPSDHIWISDDILNSALSRYLQLRVGRRHGSAVPGPLEARKRAAKRRMMGLAPTPGGLDPHPGFLTGLGRGQENQQCWQWQSPQSLQPEDPQRLHKGGTRSSPSGQLGTNWSQNPGLPAWLTDYDNKDERLTAEDKQVPDPVEQVHTDEIIPDVHHPAKSKTQEHRSPEARLEDSTCLEDMRSIIRCIKEHDPMRKTCSRLALCGLLHSRWDMDKILEFWVDPLLNPWGAANLSFFIAHCVELSKVEELRRFCEWTARQFYIGACPDRNLLLLITELSKSREQDEWRKMLVSFCQSVAQALQSSPVLRVEDLEPATYSSLITILFDDIYSSSKLELGMELVKASSPTQLQVLGGLVWPTMERWIYKWEPSRSAELSSVTLSSTITSLLYMIPKRELLEAVTAVSWRILNHPLPEYETRSLWQRHSLWWSAVQAPEVFQHIKKTSFWSQISDVLRRTQEEAIELMALREIDEHLNQNDLQAAYGTFVRNPQITLESCPHLAEALILDPDRDWRMALKLRESRQATVLAKQQSLGDDQLRKQLQDQRICLLERMASAYSTHERIPVAMIFYYVYGCWKIHERDNLGPIGPAMTRALTLCGIVRPLQARRQVSRFRAEWILRMVAEVEGLDVSRKLGATMWQWLNEGYHQSIARRNGELQQSLSRQHHEQSVQVQQVDVWDGLTAMTIPPPDAPPRRVQTAYQASPVLNMYSAGLARGENGVVREREEETRASQAPLKEASLFSKDEDNTGEAQSAEEAFMSTLVSETAAFNESISADLPPTVSSATKQYIVPTERHPPTGSSIEELQYVPEHNVRDVSWNRYVKYRARRASHISLNPSSTVAVDTAAGRSPSGTQPRYVAATETREEALDRHVREHRIHSLLVRLNGARSVGAKGFSKSLSLRLTNAYMLELASIPPCSLGRASKHGRELLGLQGYRGVTATHGMKEYQGPTTFAGAREPALGGGLFHVARILEAAERGEKHLVLAS